jgi:hypothetical protein
MMSKWSTKQTESKAVRVRNNQRRHRQRVKDRMAYLESRLDETQSQLNNALDLVEELRAELDRSRGQREPPCAHRSRADQALAGVARDQPWERDDNDGGDADQDADTDATTHAATPPAPVEDGSPICCAPTPCLTDGESAAANDSEWPSDYDDSPALPPPAPGKSTTRCRDAFAIIEQQNYRSMDREAIRRWLEPGFSQALSRGDGCRVDTERLFALLDFIRSDWEQCDL